MRRVILWLLVLTLLLPVTASAATLTADANAPWRDMSDTLYGLFFEDINCAADGGLYAELVQNRSFEYENLLNPQSYDHYTAWRINASFGSKADWELMSEAPLNEQNPTYLRASVEQGSLRLLNQGFANGALKGGISVEAGQCYDFFIYLRNQSLNGTVTAAISDAGGNPICEPATFTPGEEWSRFTATFTAEKDADAWLCITVEGQGSVDVDMLSLMPADRIGKEWPGGGVRTDLVEALKGLNPAFLRFPGGCVAEGSYVRSNEYNWKHTVGPVESRRENPNTWGGMQTYGLGFYEYFCLSEELGALPLPVVHAGVLCQAREPRERDYTLDETRAYAQDILDLIEFATGDVTTQWGALRAEMGHPEPFDLRYIAIGNENWGAGYFTRYGILSRAVKEVYPEITCIVAAGPVAEGALINGSWNSIRAKFADSLVDEHYYMDSMWFPEHVNRYDNYPRTTQVFLGEYAAHEPVQGSRRPNNLRAALCEAAYLTGIERNSDVVRMAAYAPLLAREGQQDWTPDLIWFNGTEVLLTPSYYVQQMFSATLGDQVVTSSLDDGNLFHVVTRTDSALQIKLVNLQETEVPLTLSLAGVPDGQGKATCLSGEMKWSNSFVKPMKVAPVESTCDILGGTAEVVLPACSVTIYEFPLD